MGYDINNLKNAARSLNAQLERQSQARGEALANALQDRTHAGREQWFIVLWPHGC